MNLLKKILKINLEQIDKVIDNKEKKKRHELISDEQFMSNLKNTNDRINNVRKSIQNTKQ